MTDDRRIRELSQAAEEALGQGRLDDTARLWERVLAIAPSHGQALFRLGQHALYKKDIRGAIEMLRRAVEASPREPLIRLNLAFAYRALGDRSAEMDAIDASLAIDPYFYPGLLAKGAALERSGLRRPAAQTYKDALSIVPPDEQLSQELKAAVARARKAVADNAAELGAYLGNRLGNQRNRHRGADLSRFDQCCDITIGNKKIFTQQPTLLHFPELPAIPFYRRSEFPWLDRIEAATVVIREELVALLREDATEFGPYVRHRPGTPLNQWSELNFSPKWSAYFLWQNDVRIDDHCKRCPRTAELLSAAPTAHIAGFAPTVFFSALQAGTRIPPHTGVTNARLTVHLPLIVPEKCWFRVGNDRREWKEGLAWVFDDTIEHEAFNPSDRLRIILIFDIWNPYLSIAERDMVAELLAALNSYYSVG